MKRTGIFSASEGGLEWKHAEYGRHLFDSGRITDDLPPGEIPPLPPKLVTPADPKPEPRWALWRNSRE